MPNLCIIPARGGSKRIPRKNAKKFLGKPIIAYSIEVALECGLFDEVMVSTDDTEIALLAKEYGARVPLLRSEEASNDMASLSDVVEEVASFYSAQRTQFDNICCLLATAPFVTTDLLKSAYHRLLDSNYDSIRPIVKFAYPIQRSFRLLEGGKVELAFPEYRASRSQDLEPIYHDAGLFYWMRGDTRLLTNKKGAIIISERVSQDIDTEEDWEFAELKYRILKNG